MPIRTGVVAYVALAALAAAVFTLFPHIDLWASGLFYHHGFDLGSNAVFRFLFRLVLVVSDGLAVALPLVLLIVLWRQKPLLGLDRRALVFLILALAIGPGIVVNTMLKDHWGRARPSQVTEFGGSKEFTPALEPADQCGRNCSFPAGHPALGFYFVSFALLIPAARGRRIVFGAALAAGGLLGVMRMAQGGHFLSDVVFSGFIVVGTSWLLYEVVMRHRLGAGAVGWRRMALIGLACTVAAVLCIAFYDRPVAILAHRLDPALIAAAAVVSWFGLSTGYLTGCAIIFVALMLAAPWARPRAVAARLRRNAWRAAFLFVTVAVSGLAADLLKVIFGRARPKLFFRDGLYGFTWHDGGPEFWSFPSGHAAIASALALSLTMIWPRGWPAWWGAALLIMASRLGVGAHYPSDLIAGFYLAALTVWGARAGFDRLGLTLRESP